MIAGGRTSQEDYRRKDWHSPASRALLRVLAGLFPSPGILPRRRCCHGGASRQFHIQRAIAGLLHRGAYLPAASRLGASANRHARARPPDRRDGWNQRHRFATNRRLRNISDVRHAAAVTTAIPAKPIAMIRQPRTRDRRFRFPVAPRRGFYHRRSDDPVQFFPSYVCYPTYIFLDMTMLRHHRQRPPAAGG